MGALEKFGSGIEFCVLFLASSVLLSEFSGWHRNIYMYICTFGHVFVGDICITLITVSQ